jgi:hypothetical protein
MVTGGARLGFTMSSPLEQMASQEAEDEGEDEGENEEEEGDAGPWDVEDPFS